MSRLRIAVIGTGGIAEKHLDVLAAFPDVEIVALCNRGNPRIHSLAERFGGCKTFSDYRQLLDQVSLDAIFVLVSVVNVVEVAAECLRRGIPTLLEKPPGLTVAETQGLLAIAQSTQCINLVALNRRFYGVMQAAREAILAVGPLVSMVVEAPESLEEVRTLGIHPPQVLEKFLFANGIHCLDLMRFFGGEVTRVCSFSHQWFDTQKDAFGALVQFESSAVGHYISNWTTPARWSISLYGRGRRVLIKPLERATLFESDGTERELPVSDVDLTFKPGLYAQNRYFLDCVRQGVPVSYPAADLADAVKTMELIAAIEAGQP